MQKRSSIISSVNQCRSLDKKRTHKWGIQVPATVKKALALDEVNKNTLWTDVVAKKMKNVRVAFNTLQDGRLPSKGKTSFFLLPSRSGGCHINGYGNVFYQCL